MGLIHSLSVLCGNVPRLRQRKGFARSSLVFGGEAAELEPEFTLK
jgi:hypothetical protein